MHLPSLPARLLPRPSAAREEDRFRLTPALRSLVYAAPLALLLWVLLLWSALRLLGAA